MEALKVDIAQHGQATVMTLSGPLTTRHVAALRRAAFQAESDRPGHCILDLTDVEEIDGYGLSTLVGMLARRSSQQGKVVLFGIRPDLRERFEATFCDSLFPLRSSLAHALEVVGEGQ